MNPTPAEMLKGMPRSVSATTPPTVAKGTLRNTRSAGPHLTEGEPEQEDDQPEGDRDDEGEARPRRSVVPGTALPIRCGSPAAARTLGRDRGLRIIDNGDEVAAAHVELDAPSA